MKILILFFCVVFALNVQAQNSPYITDASPMAFEDSLWGKRKPDLRADDLVFTEVEKKPEFLGGRGALFKFIQNNFVYPSAARDSGITGKVYLTFVIDSVGNVRNAKVLKGAHPLLDEAALKILYRMPLWIPGMQDGRPVNVQYNLPPIRFEINKEED